MPNNPAGTTPCVECEQKLLELWISHNPTDPDPDWWQIRNCDKQRKVATRDNANTTVLNGTPVNLCSVNSKSWQYQIDTFHCAADPIENYLRDADSVGVRVVNGVVASDAFEEFTATFDDDGWSRDSQNNGFQPRTLLFDVSGAITRANYTDVAGTQYDPNA